MRAKRSYRCTYVVSLEPDACEREIRGLAAYLSALRTAGCEVLILDDGPATQFRERQRILRWVGKYRHRQEIDPFAAAAEMGTCEKIIVATSAVRYTTSDIEQVCDLLDRHEAVEPEEFVAPLPWWGGLEAGKLLLQRGVDQPARSGSTLAIQKSALHPLLVAHRPEGLFVRREPPLLQSWWRLRPRDLGGDFSTPLKASIFLGMIPVLVLLALAGGSELAGGYAAVMALSSVMVAARGRAGATRFFPVHICLYAPLWLLERSISVYWASLARLRHGTGPSDERRRDQPAEKAFSASDSLS